MTLRLEDVQAAHSVQQALKTHLGPGLFRGLGDAYYPLLLGAAGLAVFWLILLWMYKRKIFLRI